MAEGAHAGKDTVKTLRRRVFLWVSACLTPADVAPHVVSAPGRGGVLPPRRGYYQQLPVMLLQARAFQACQYVPASARNRPWLVVGPTVVRYSALPVVFA